MNSSGISYNLSANGAMLVRKQMTSQSGRGQLTMGIGFILRKQRAPQNAACGVAGRDCTYFKEASPLQNSEILLKVRTHAECHL